MPGIVSYRISKIITVVVSSIIFVTACAGIGVVYPERGYEIENPAIGTTSGHYYRNSNNREFTCEQVYSLWGEPDDDIKNGINELLIYKEGLVFAGVIPFIIIPVPLALPVGQKKIYIECENDIVVRASKTWTRMSAAYCGMISEKPEFGCQID